MKHMETKISQPIFGILVALRKNEAIKIYNEPGIGKTFATTHFRKSQLIKSDKSQRDYYWLRFYNDHKHSTSLCYTKRITIIAIYTLHGKLVNSTSGYWVDINSEEALSRDFHENIRTH